MARKILDIFLSSTALDLESHRTAIHAELMSTGLFHCVRQEDFGPQDAGAVEFCREKVKASDIFIGLTGHRRGWEPEGDSAKRSITEMEHDWAKEAGCRRYLYVAPNEFPLPNNLRDSDELHARQQAFRKRVRDGGERVVSQKGFENPERFAADIVKHILTQLITGNLITQSPPELLAQSRVSPDEQRPAIAAAVERLAEDDDVDLLTLAKNPKDANLAELEAKLRARAEAQEARGQAALKTGAEYWRHIGALAFLHDTQKALAAYEKAVALDSRDPEGWRYLGELQYRLGDLASAERSFSRLLELGTAADDRQTQSIGYVRLEWIALQTGDLPKAETLATEAVRCAEAADWQEGMARAYGNLGIVYRTRGDLDGAEDMQRKALALNEGLGSKEGMARAYGNLGIIHGIRGDLDKAEAMHLKSLGLEEELGNDEGMAADYGNLGIIYGTRGDFDRAEDMQRKALALNERLGNKRGMANDYGNLGSIYSTRGNLDSAEQMYRKSLTLSEGLGNKETMASLYFNLASIYHNKGNKAALCDCLRKARELYNKMSLPNRAAEMEGWLKENRCDDC